MKKTKIMILMILLIMTFTGCSTSTKSEEPKEPKEIKTSELEKSDAYYDYYDFTSEVYHHYKPLGYDDNFIIAVACTALYESGGDPTAIEYKYQYREEYETFLKESDTSDISMLLEIYHSYGNHIFEATDIPYEAYRNAEGEFCYGIGLLMWCGNRGDQILQYCVRNWKTNEAQFDFIDYDIENHYGALKPENFKTNSPKEAIQTFATVYTGVSEDRLDIIYDYIEPVQEIVNSLK